MGNLLIFPPRIRNGVAPEDLPKLESAEQDFYGVVSSLGRTLDVLDQMATKLELLVDVFPTKRLRTQFKETRLEILENISRVRREVDKASELSKIIKGNENG